MFIANRLQTHLQSIFRTMATSTGLITLFPLALFACTGSLASSDFWLLCFVCSPLPMHGKMRLFVPPGYSSTPPAPRRAIGSSSVPVACYSITTMQKRTFVLNSNSTATGKYKYLQIQIRDGRIMGVMNLAHKCPISRPRLSF